MLKLTSYDISTDDADCVVRRRGTGIYGRAITVRPDDTVDDYEEVPLELIEAEEADRMADEKRAAAISSRIRTRYTVDDEIAILRQRDSKPEEFARYNAFVESIKADIP